MPFNKKLYEKLSKINTVTPCTLTFGAELGKGTYGIVYHGLNGNKAVAIKKQVGCIDTSLNEIFILEKLMEGKSPNIIEYCGNIIEPNQAFIIMEYAGNGSLSDFIIKNEPLNWDKRKGLIHGISSGLAFIHKLKIIHGDIKCSNIVIDSKLTPKIIDFGLSEFETNTMRGRGTKGYFAPEILSNGKNSTASDVFSSAIVYWMISLWDRFLSQPNQCINGQRPEIPGDCPNNIKLLINWSWSEDPYNRPSAAKVEELIKKELETDINNSKGELKSISTTQEFHSLNSLSIFNRSDKTHLYFADDKAQGDSKTQLYFEENSAQADPKTQEYLENNKMQLDSDKTRLFYFDERKISTDSEKTILYPSPMTIE